MPQWELLVTDGHVRVARWRVASKFLVATGIFLIVLGLAGTWALPPRKSSSHILDAKQRLVDARRQSLIKFIAARSAPPATLPENADKAFSLNDAQTFIEILRSTLNQTDKLPENVERLSPEQFWSGAWQPGAVAAVSARRSYLIGIYINQAAAYPRFQGTEPQISLARFFGLFHKADLADSKWVFYCLNVPGAPPCGRIASISPELIPDTLRDLTPAEARQ